MNIIEINKHIINIDTIISVYILDKNSYRIKFGNGILDLEIKNKNERELLFKDMIKIMTNESNECYINRKSITYSNEYKRENSKFIILYTISNNIYFYLEQKEFERIRNLLN